MCEPIRADPGVCPEHALDPFDPRFANQRNAINHFSSETLTSFHTDSEFLSNSFHSFRDHRDGGTFGPEITILVEMKVPESTQEDPRA